jgi:hypothetical protein
MRLPFSGRLLSSIVIVTLLSYVAPAAWSKQHPLYLSTDTTNGWIDVTNNAGGPTWGEYGVTNVTSLCPSVPFCPSSIAAADNFIAQVQSSKKWEFKREGIQTGRVQFPQSRTPGRRRHGCSEWNQSIQRE